MGHKFKVGDKVKVHYLTGNRIGYIQERKSELRYDIRYDEGCIGHDIEENRIVKYNGNQDMGIKVGDKVRVSKDAPGIYMKTIFPNLVSSNMEVTEIGYGFARIKPLICECEYLTFEFAIPTKYLIKVEDEAKVPKFKVGDKVKDISSPHDSGIYKVDDIKKSSDGFLYHIQGLIGKSNVKESDLEPYTEPTAPTIKVGDMVRCKSPLRLKNSTDDDFIGTVTDAENGWFIVHMNNGAVFQTCNAADLELVQPKEQTEAEETNPDNLKKIAEEWANNVSNAIEEYGDAMCKIYVEAHNEAYWDAYAADLAKEIAVKITNKKMDNTPEQAAGYAVSVAKAVVENLKKK